MTQTIFIQPIRLLPKSLHYTAFSIERTDKFVYTKLKQIFHTLFSSGGSPYPGWTQQKVVHQVQNGYRMEKPSHVGNFL